MDGFRNYLSEINAVKMITGLIIGKVMSDLVMVLLDEFINPISEHYLMRGEDKKLPYFFGSEINLTAIINKFIVSLFGLLVAYILYRYFGDGHNQSGGGSILDGLGDTISSKSSQVATEIRKVGDQVENVGKEVGKEIDNSLKNLVIESTSSSSK